MVDLTEEIAVTPQDLKTWYELKEELARVKGAEAMLRSRIFKHYFPTPTEGSKDNKVPLNDGTGAILQADYVINRTVDEQQLDALRSAIAEDGSNLPQLDLTKLIRWKPELVTGEYRKLSETERLTLDQALIIKPGSPQMEIKIPKRPA
jgi:hypothetical protein